MSFNPTTLSKELFFLQVHFGKRCKLRHFNKILNYCELIDAVCNIYPKLSCILKVSKSDKHESNDKNEIENIDDEIDGDSKNDSNDNNNNNDNNGDRRQSVSSSSHSQSNANVNTHKTIEMNKSLLSQILWHFETEDSDWIEDETDWNVIVEQLRFSFNNHTNNNNDNNDDDNDSNDNGNNDNDNSNGKTKTICYQLTLYVRIEFLDENTKEKNEKKNKENNIESFINPMCLLDINSQYYTRLLTNTNTNSTNDMKDNNDNNNNGTSSINTNQNPNPASKSRFSSVNSQKNNTSEKPKIDANGPSVPIIADGGTDTNTNVNRSGKHSLDSQNDTSMLPPAKRARLSNSNSSTNTNGNVSDHRSNSTDNKHSQHQQKQQQQQQQQRSSSRSSSNSKSSCNSNSNNNNKNSNSDSSSSFHTLMISNVNKEDHFWCVPCNDSFTVNCFESHVCGKKHLKFIDQMGLRKTLFHWQSTRTKRIFDLSKYNEIEIKKLLLDDSLWYAQVCLCCLAECHHRSWIDHSQSKRHQSTWFKNPRIVELRRAIALAEKNEMEQENKTTDSTGGDVLDSNSLPILFTEDYFSQIANYRAGSKVLVLGEQDFSYSLAVSRILENNGLVIGTSYLGPFDENSQYIEPEEHPKDDGIRANYFRRTLPSHNGVLTNNLNTLHRNGVITAHNIDATILYENLKDQNLIQHAPFDIIVFPFPRVSLKRGLDFRNSLLVQGFFHNLRKYREKLLYGHSQIQLLILENQFKEWDFVNIAKENGWKLKWRCLVNFDMLSGYQPRELSGKAWKPSKFIITNNNNNGAWFLVFQFDENYQRTEKELQLLDKLNSCNQDALKFENFGPTNANMNGGMGFNVGMMNGNGTGNVNGMNAMSNGDTAANGATMNSMATATSNENTNTNVGTNVATNVSGGAVATTGPAADVRSGSGSAGAVVSATQPPALSPGI